MSDGVGRRGDGMLKEAVTSLYDYIYCYSLFRLNKEDGGGVGGEGEERVMD